MGNKTHTHRQYCSKPDRCNLCKLLVPIPVSDPSMSSGKPVQRVVVVVVVSCLLIHLFTCGPCPSSTSSWGRCWLLLLLLLLRIIAAIVATCNRELATCNCSCIHK